LHRKYAKEILVTGGKAITIVKSVWSVYHHKVTFKRQYRFLHIFYSMGISEDCLPISSEYSTAIIDYTEDPCKAVLVDKILFVAS
jgi:hypothetical protein